MIHLAAILLVGMATRCLGLSFSTLDGLDSHLDAPPESLGFSPWDSCGALHGGYGVRSDGWKLGSEEYPTAVWPVGPHAFIHAHHINPGPLVKVVYLGQEYNVTERYELQSDVVLLIVDGTLDSYHALWRGYSEVTNVTVKDQVYNIPGFGQVVFNRITNETVVATSIGSKLMVGVSGGPFGFGVCAAPGAPRVAWGLASNCVAQPARWQSMRYAMSNPLAYTYSPMTVYGPSFSIPYMRDDAANFGAWTGDSGGAVFIEDGGKWWLAGLMNSGGNCRGAEIGGAFAFNAPAFSQEYWSAVAQDKLPQFLALRSHFATEPKYQPCGGTDPVAVDPPPFEPPSPSDPIVARIKKLEDDLATLKAKVDSIELLVDFPFSAGKIAPLPRFGP